MNKYVVLCTFERGGIDALVAEDQPLGERVKQLANSTEFGEDDEQTKVKDIMLTTGIYDLVAIVEAANLDNALAFLIAFSSLGRCSTTTLAAVSDVSKVVKAAHEAHTKMGEAGGG
jgi:uncharacterized protein with GYD domain